MLQPIKIASSLFFILLSLQFMSCGNNAGVDPHLSQEEVEEITEINLVGKWKIRRPSSVGKGNFAKNNEACTVNELEFFEDGSYLLLLSTVASNGDEKKIYRGNYGLVYSEENNEIFLSKIVLMGTDFTIGSSLPESGTIATFTDLDLTSTNISFSAILGEGTSDFCTVGTAIDLSGEKSEPVAPEAGEESNHTKLTKAWRLVQISATIEGTTDANGTLQNLCYFFDGERGDRCEDDNGNIADDCPYAATLTLLISEYGTYLFTFYDLNGNVLSEDLGDWRWRETAIPFSEFEVKAPNETYEESDTVIYVGAITESTLSLREISLEEDQEGNEQTIFLDYEFQLESLPFQNINCSSNE